MMVIPSTPATMIRVVDCSLRAIGGNANATSIIIRTGHTTPVVIWTANLAALTQDTLLRASLASGGNHAIGAGFNADLKTGGGVKIIASAAESQRVRLRVHHQLHHRRAMSIVRILKTPDHTWGAAPWVPVGETMDIYNEGLVAYMVDRGEAEVVPEPKVVPKPPEAAVVEPQERAVKPPARARKG